MTLEDRIEAENIGTCPDCLTAAGHLHRRGCALEPCPFCGGRLVSCDCRFAALGFQSSGFFPGCDGEVRPDGLTKVQDARWRVILEARGRVPFIWYPNLCRKCGQLWPAFFQVPDQEWRKYTEPAMRREILCRKCYQDNKRLIDAAARKPRPYTRKGA